MTIYLKFNTQAQAEAELINAGYELSEYKDHFSGDGWGAVFVIPDTANAVYDEEGNVVSIPLIQGIHANIYDCAECPESLLSFVIAEPNNPFNRVY